VFAKPGGNFVAAQATGGNVEHQTFPLNDRRFDLAAVEHEERFHRGVPDALVAIQKRAVTHAGAGSARGRWPQPKADSSLRCALQKLDALLVSIEQLGPSLSESSSPRN